MTPKPKWTFACWALVLLTFALSKAGVAQLVLYDNFNSKQIDPSKWNGWQFFDPDVREATRQLVGEEENRRLRLSQTAYSATTDDSGGSGGGFGLACGLLVQRCLGQRLLKDLHVLGD